MASGTSRKTELTLINVARASLEELLIDDKDYLRQNGLQLWDKDHPKAAYIRNLASNRSKSFKTYKTYIADKSPETAANTMICAIHQASYLFDRIKSKIERVFLQEGGITERMRAARSGSRRKNRNCSPQLAFVVRIGRM